MARPNKSYLSGYKSWLTFRFWFLRCLNLFLDVAPTRGYQKSGLHSDERSTSSILLQPLFLVRLMARSTYPSFTLFFALRLPYSLHWLMKQYSQLDYFLHTALSASKCGLDAQ